MLEIRRDGFGIGFFGFVFARIGVVTALRFGKFAVYERVDRVRRIFGFGFIGWRYAP
jgi:hypothetical protein